MTFQSSSTPNFLKAQLTPLGYSNFNFDGSNFRINTYFRNTIEKIVDTNSEIRISVNDENNRAEFYTGAYSIVGTYYVFPIYQSFSTDTLRTGTYYNIEFDVVNRAAESAIIGPTGPVGDTGQIGPTGLKGDTGQVGPTGLKGDTGQVGPTGLKGDTGSVGPTGLKGDTGQVGPTGLKGDTGQVGPTGLKGDTGQIGPTGLKGDTGQVGPTGLKGDTGQVGPTGAAPDFAASAGLILVNPYTLTINTQGVAETFEPPLGDAIVGQFGADFDNYVNVGMMNYINTVNKLYLLGFNVSVQTTNPTSDDLVKVTVLLDGTPLNGGAASSTMYVSKDYPTSVVISLLGTPLSAANFLGLEITNLTSDNDLTFYYPTQLGGFAYTVLP